MVDGYEFVANIKGPTGSQGPQGVQGLSGAGGATTDAATASLVGAGVTSVTNDALATQFAGVTGVTPGAAMQKGAAGTARIVALTGHSLMYGQDTSGTGTTAATNGASQTRSVTPTTVQFLAQSLFTSVSARSIVNQGYPGDRSTEVINRWSTGASGDIEFFWLDTNDAMNYAGYSGTLTDAQTAANLRDLILRARGRGAEVVVVGGAPIGSAAASRKVFASAETDRTIATRYGARYVDVGEMLTALPVGSALHTDGVHLSPQAYSLIGARLAALLGPKGTHPPHASAGRRFTPRDYVHVGGTETTRTGSTTGKTLLLNAGETLAIPVDVTAPVIPILRLYGTGTTAGYGKVGIYSSLGVAGQPLRTVDLTGTGSSSGNVQMYVPCAPMLSPGPDAVVIRCESGTIEVDSISFEPVSRRSLDSGASDDFSRYREIKLHPVGGVGQRSDATWDAMVDIGSGVSLRGGISGSNVGVRWLFDLTLGYSYSGVILTQTSVPGSYISRGGYHILRNGSDLILRKWDANAATDTVVASVFAATGMVRAIITVIYDPTADALNVFVDGVSKGSIATPGYKFLSAGLLAGASTSTGGFASGSAAAYMATTADYV